MLKRNTFDEFIGYIAQNHSGNTAVTHFYNDSLRETTYSELQNDIYAFSEFLKSILPPMSHICLISENSYEWLTAFFAAVCSGFIVVPVDTDKNTDDIRKITEESHAKAVIVSEMFGNIFNDLPQIIFTGKTKMDFYTKDVSVRNKRDDVELKNLGGLNLNPDDECLIMFTSGTAGACKGVVLTHDNIISDTIATLSIVDGKGPTLAVLPFYHMFGLVCGIFLPFYLGVNLVINNDLKYIGQNLTRFKPKTLIMVPLMLKLMNAKIWSEVKKARKTPLVKILIFISGILMLFKIDLRRKLFAGLLSPLGGDISLIVCGGSHLEYKYIKSFHDIGITVLNGYGLTECSPIVSVNRKNDYLNKSVGSPIPCCQVKIDELTGEILVSGTNIMKKYYRNEKLTKDLFENSWYKTGDIGYMDRHGKIFIRGRKDNIIILDNGKNIYPEELEQLIKNNKHVEDVMVYASKNGANTSLTAEIFIRAATLGEPAHSKKQAVEAYIREMNLRLPFFKKIGSVVFRETDFKRNSSRKIFRETRG